MSLLFSPHAVGPLTLKNRVVIAAMCQYFGPSRAYPSRGTCSTWGGWPFPARGRGIVEATGVEAAGRITPDDTGLWNDEQAAAFAAIIRDIRTYSDTPIGIQLGHAGRKASTSAPWKGGGALAADDGAWETFAPSALPFKADWHTPTQMTEADMDRVVAAFEAAARRAERAGFDLVELHAAHGYLLSEFLSPISNQRTDAFGGSAGEPGALSAAGRPGRARRLAQGQGLGRAVQRLGLGGGRRGAGGGGGLRPGAARHGL